MNEDKPNSNSAKLVMKSSNPGSSRLDLPGMKGEFTAATREWMKVSWGPGAEPIIRHLKTSGTLYAPAVGMMDSFMNAPSINDPNWKPLRSSDITYGTHMALVTLPNGKQVGQVAAYTSLELLKNKEIIQETNAYEWLKEALSMEDSDGAVLNPKTRFMRDEVSESYYSLTRFGLAELLGFLEIEDIESPRPFHELANESFASGKYFQVLYYWSRSFRTPRSGDNWKEAEVAKLRSYYALNFPGFRDRARGELDWMTKTHPSDELVPLAAEFRDK